MDNYMQGPGVIQKCFVDPVEEVKYAEQVYGTPMRTTEITPATVTEAVMMQNVALQPHKTRKYKVDLLLLPTSTHE